jgi:Zinc carboxypeptidase
MRRLLTIAVVAAALMSTSTATAAPVATSDGAYTALGKVFPEPQGGCPGSPCSPNALGQAPAATFLGYRDFVDGLKYMNQRKEWQRYIEVWPLDGKIDDNANPAAGTDEKAAFPGNNLGSFEFTPKATFRSAGLPGPTLDRVKSDILVARVTDETVPDDDKKRYALSLSIHGIERAGIEGGVRTLEDLVTASTLKGRDGKVLFNSPILKTSGLSVPSPTYGDVLKKTVIYFTFPNPDGWRRGDSDVDKGPGLFFQRYNGNGVDPNRDFPDIGFAFRPYSALSEPESQSISSALTDVKRNAGPFAAGDDLHGMLGADSFSYTLMPHGSHDFAKNERIREAAKSINLVQQDLLKWSPMIQPNNRPPGQCAENPATGEDCAPMYGQSWGSVYDTINYTTTGTLGDWFDSSVGLNADGIDNEMAYSHLDKNIAFDALIEQMHVDGNRGLIFAHLAEMLNARDSVFPARGQKGYVPLGRVKRSEKPSSIGAPPGTSPQQDQQVDQPIGPDGNATYVFDPKVRRDATTYNGGMRIEATLPNIQGITPSSATSKLIVQCKGCDRHPGVKDEAGEWVTVTQDYNQGVTYLSAGLVATVNEPEFDGQSGKPVEWRAIVETPVGPIVRFKVNFLAGQASSDGETGGGTPPRLAAYDVASTDFWKQLNRYTTDVNRVEPVDADDLAKGSDEVPSKLDSLILTEEALPGYVYPPPAASEIQAPITANTGPRAPCAMMDGNPRVPSCYEAVAVKVNPGQGSMKVSADPTNAQTDIALEITRVNGDGSEDSLGFNDGGSFDGTETLEVSSPPAGDYKVYVYNWAGPDSSAAVKVEFAPPPAGDRGKTRYTDAQYATYVKKVREFVTGGGNLVLTDGALQILPDLFPGKIKRSDVSMAASYVGQIGFTTKSTAAKDPATAGNTLADPLAKNVKQPGARFNNGLRRQTYEPTPLGFSIQNKDSGSDESHSEVWQVSRPAFEAAGGRVAGTSITASPRSAKNVTNQVTLGELTLGDGRVRLLGALLPQPTQEFDHQEGLEPFAVTYTGYFLAENLTDWCKPGRNCPVPRRGVTGGGEGDGTGGGTETVCAANNGFRTVSAAAQGKGLSLSFARRLNAPVTVDVLAQQRGTNAGKATRVARFKNQTRGLTWNGKPTVKGQKVRDGIYVVRYTIPKRKGKSEVRQVVLERKKGKWKRRPDFERRPSCDAISGYTLFRPVFGGKTRRSLRISYRLARASTATVVVKRGKKTIKRFKANKASAKKTYILKLASSKLGRGDYTVTLTVLRGKAKTTSKLTARRL